MQAKIISRWHSGCSVPVSDCQIFLNINFSFCSKTTCDCDCDCDCDQKILCNYNLKVICNRQYMKNRVVYIIPIKHSQKMVMYRRPSSEGSDMWTFHLEHLSSHFKVMFGLILSMFIGD